MKIQKSFFGGYTLGELLITIAVVALLMVGGFSILGQLIWVAGQAVWLLGQIIWITIEMLPLLILVFISCAAFAWCMKQFGPRPPLL